MEMLLKPEAPTFQKLWAFNKNWNKKRSLILNSFPIVNSYYKNIEEHPLLVNYFKERPADREMEF